MNKSHLLNILRSCSKKELRELGKWVHSPAHNQREDVQQLFEYLVGDDNLEKDEFLAKEVVFKQLFPKEKYDDAKLRQSIYFLTKAVEDYLVYSEINEDTIFKDITLLKVLRKRKLDRTFRKGLRQVERVVEQHARRDAEFYTNAYYLQQEKYFYTVSQRRTIPMNLQEVSDSLDITYLADKLRQSCHMLAHQRVYKTDYDNRLLPMVLSYVENNELLLKIPAIAVYYYGFLAVSNQDSASHFYALKEQIFQSYQLFSIHEMQDIYLMAINYCIGKMNAGENEFIKESFELYRDGFEKGFFFIDKKSVSRWTFQNAILNGLMLKEFDWVERFIQDYQEYIDEQYRENVVSYSMARLYYDKGDFDQSLQFINNADYDDILINLGARVLQIKIFFQQEELSLLDSLLESMRTYLSRKKVMGYHQSNYKNIIRYTKKLVKMNPYNQAHREKLRNEIRQANPLTEREWLLQQVDKR